MAKTLPRCNYVYHQRSGRLELWCGSRLIGLVADCYSGNAAGLNNPEMEHAKSVGPVPQGRYFIRLAEHPRFKAPAYRLDPDKETEARLAALGRSGFWIHGDNSAGNRSASHGCVVVDPDARWRMRPWVTSNGCCELIVKPE